MNVLEYVREDSMSVGSWTLHSLPPDDSVQDRDLPTIGVAYIDGDCKTILEPELISTSS